MRTVELATTDLGQGKPVVILHGLFGRRRNWQGIQKRLAADARIVAADLRNHGDSPWSDIMTYGAMADDLANLIETTFDGAATVVGHSMGGKAAMDLALRYPDIVDALVVIDIAPVPYAHNYAPYIDAMRRVPLAQLSRRGEAEAYLGETLKDSAIRAFILQNLGQDDDGLKWQVNLDAIEAGMPNILDFPDTGAAKYEGPSLFIAGGSSDYIDQDERARIGALFPSARHQVIKDAGHWVHAEKPAAVIGSLSAFIDEQA